MGKIVGKNLEWPFLAILNLYLSFWEKLLAKIWNGHFWLFQIYTSLFGKNCWQKFGTALFGHSKFTCLFGKNCQKKFRMAIFGHSKCIPVFLGKIVRKNLEWPFLAILNLYQSFKGKIVRKIWNGHFWPFQKLYQSFWEKLSEKIQNGHLWPL